MVFKHHRVSEEYNPRNAPFVDSNFEGGANQRVFTKVSRHLFDKSVDEYDNLQNTGYEVGNEQELQEDKSKALLSTGTKFWVKEVPTRKRDDEHNENEDYQASK